MSVSKKEYAKMTEKASPPSPSYLNYPKAFLVGGLICCLGQGLTNFYKDVIGKEIIEARACTSITLIGITAVLTALGWFSYIAKHAGAGTVVPITGFANAVVSPAIEFKSEGQIFGVGAKMFIIAGPVIVYGTFAAFIYGFIYWIAQRFL